jgi:hypothetical protein
MFERWVASPVARLPADAYPLHVFMYDTRGEHLGAVKMEAPVPGAWRVDLPAHVAQIHVETAAGDTLKWVSELPVIDAALRRLTGLVLALSTGYVLFVALWPFEPLLVVLGAVVGLPLITLPVAVLYDRRRQLLRGENGWSRVS